MARRTYDVELYHELGPDDDLTEWTIHARVLPPYYPRSGNPWDYDDGEVRFGAATTAAGASLPWAEWCARYGVSPETQEVLETSAIERGVEEQCEDDDYGPEYEPDDA